eukprot:CAMPEP_0167744336 /NCGR_PEP_ID=MMETSP0110_2-20121227/2532_1 /TAXON_ID=629695 /ORGANISM="Gymnochlora sp., Strain CCMP2014" /LENGTH=316 /DNA_ID=CAMNT_0007628841 /DNA_START=102 /DNA_END=1048 /DNA_ORIENTATION=+
MDAKHNKTSKNPLTSNFELFTKNKNWDDSGSATGKAGGEGSGEKRRFILPVNRDNIEGKEWEPAESWNSSKDCARVREMVRHHLRYDSIMGSLNGLDGVDSLEFTVAVLGDRGVGKTTTILNLCDIKPTIHQKQTEYLASNGVIEYNAYWPFKLLRGGSPIVVRIRFLDVGLSCFTDDKTKHELSISLSRDQCSDADAAIYICAATSLKSYKTVHGWIAKASNPKPMPPVKAVVMTWNDHWVRRAISTHQLMEFRSKFSIPAFRLSNIYSPESKLVERHDACSILKWQSLLQVRVKQAQLEAKSARETEGGIQTIA